MNSQTVKRGVWVAKIVSTSVGWRVQLDSPRGASTWPIQYDDGVIAYDFDVPRDGQRAARAAFQLLRSHNVR